MRAQGMGEEQIALCSLAAERIIAAKALHDAPDAPAEALKAEIRSQMYAAWRRLPADTPAVMVFDDLHWADPASAELITFLLRLAQEKPMLFLLAFRPERQSPAWQIKLKAEADSFGRSSSRGSSFGQKTACTGRPRHASKTSRSRTACRHC